MLLSAVAPRAKQTLTQVLYRHPRILSFLKCQAAKGEPDGPAFTRAQRDPRATMKSKAERSTSDKKVRKLGWGPLPRIKRIARDKPALFPGN